MESWRKVWRDGLAPQFSLAGIEALALALATDDEQLLQGQTTCPPPLQCVQDWPPEGACAVGYCGWQGDRLETVAEVCEFFAVACFRCDALLNEPASCRWFLNWFDETPREEVRRQLLPEVEQDVARRLGALESPATAAG